MTSTIRKVRLWARVAVLILMVSNAKAETPPDEDSAPASLKTAGRRAYAALRRRDLDVILSMLSADSVLIAARRDVWPKTETHVARKAARGAFPLALDDLAPLVWEDREVQFDTKEPTDVPQLKKALLRFAHEVDNTYGELGVALHQMDTWQVREMGPSVEGKMASNYFWYIQFRKEGKRWKIWKLELAEH